MQKIKNKFLQSFKKDKNNCWVWIHSLDKDGYGRFYINNKIKEERAHRISYKFFKGKIPEGMWILHKCDNPSCVNPSHLWLGTVLDNHKDMDKKNRRINVKGENHGMSKLTKKTSKTN